MFLEGKHSALSFKKLGLTRSRTARLKTRTKIGTNSKHLEPNRNTIARRNTNRW